MLLRIGFMQSSPFFFSQPAVSATDSSISLTKNSKLKNVEWLYRYERGLNRDLNVVMHRERQMLHGTTHEVDS